MTSNIIIPVAIHKWFESGEGWALHPYFASHPRLNPASTCNALSAELSPADLTIDQPRQTFVRRIDGTNAAFVGYRELESRSGAEGRDVLKYSLRAALVQDTIDTRQVEEIVIGLRQFHVTQPGYNDQLEIHSDASNGAIPIFVDPTPGLSHSKSKPRAEVSLRSAPAKSFLVAVAIVLTLFSIAASKSPKPKLLASGIFSKLGSKTPELPEYLKNLAAIWRLNPENPTKEALAGEIALAVYKTFPSESCDHDTLVREILGVQDPNAQHESIYNLLLHSERGPEIAKRVRIIFPDGTEIDRLALVRGLAGFSESGLENSDEQLIAIRRLLAAARRFPKSGAEFPERLVRELKSEKPHLIVLALFSFLCEPGDYGNAVPQSPALLLPGEFIALMQFRKQFPAEQDCQLQLLSKETFSSWEGFAKSSFAIKILREEETSIQPHFYAQDTHLFRPAYKCANEILGALREIPTPVPSSKQR